jgi:general secretion pathway protein K
MMGQRQHDGVALVVVLWLLILLTIVVGVFATLARTEALQARFLFDTTEARYAAEAGVHRAVFEMMNPDIETRWVPDGRPYTVEFAGTSLEIRIRDESGKINLNSASEDLLAELFYANGVDELRAVSLADAIADWRDEDDIPREYGAEIDEYYAAGLPYGPANQPFSSVAELQQVLGMTWELFLQTRDLFTIQGGGAMPNPAFASAEVLAAFPDMDLESAQQFVADREQTDHNDLAALIMPNGMVVSLSTGSRNFSVVSRATLPNGTWSAIHATLSLGVNSRGRPFRVRYWREQVED